nr:CHASE4 domain-containing protein [uncultured Methanoregula sp.]
MQIRNKTLLALGVTFAVLFGIIVGISLYLYMDELGNLEYQQTQKEVNQVKNLLANEQEDLISTLHDWAYWDETYSFATGHDPAYISRNLNGNSLQTLRLNLFMVADPSGNPLYETMVDPATGRQEPFPADLPGALSPSHPLLNHTSLTSTKTGYLLLPEGPMIVVSTPVLTSFQAGPTTGVLVMGRSLDTKFLARLDRMTGTGVTLHAADDPDLTEPERQILANPSANTGIMSIPVSSDLVSGYTIVQDINGRNMLLRVDQPRDIYRHGLSMIIIYLILFACTIFVAAALVMYFMDRVVLRRVEFLTRKVGHLGENGGNPGPELSGNDEIALLERKILDSHNNLIASEHTLRTFIDAVSDPAMMLKPDGTIILANAALARHFNRPAGELAGTKIRNYLPEQESLLHSRKFSEAMSGKKVVQYESEDNGKEFFVSIYPVVKESGDVEQIAVLGVDITDRKRAENALLLAKKKLTFLNRVIFEDIQNQIFVQLAYFSLARSKKGGLEIRQILEKEAEATKAIQYQLGFLQKYQMLGMNPPRWRNLSEVMLFAESHLDLGSIKIEKPSRSLELYADPLLENVFFNLFENSLLHGGHVSTIRVELHEGTGGLLISIVDDGIGVPEDRKEEIFSKGIGARGEVGLFLAREILGITGITIRETGVPGKGARFEMLVPRGMYRFSGT